MTHASTSLARLRIAAMCGMALSIAGLLYARFFGVDHQIVAHLQRAAAPALYPNDYAVTHSIVPRTTPVFALLSWLRVDLVSPWFIYPAYLTVTAIAAAGVWTLLAEVMEVRSTRLRFTILFAAIFADSKVRYATHASWIMEHNFSLSFPAAALRTWFLVYALRGDYSRMAMLLGAVNLIAPKLGWPLLALAFVILVADRTSSVKAWLACAVAALPVVMAVVASPTGSDRRAVFDILISIYPDEDNPFVSSPIAFPLIWALLTVTWLFGSRVKSEVGRRLKAMTFASAAIFLLGGIYLTWAYQLVAIPGVVLASPARAVESISLLGYLASLVWVTRVPELRTYTRVGLVMALMLLKVNPTTQWIVVAAAIAGAAVAAQWMSPRDIRRGAGDEELRETALMTGVCLLGVLATVFLTGVTKTRRQPARWYAGLGFHEGPLPASVVPILREIAGRPGDHRMLFITESDHGYVSAEWNRLVRKSAVLGDPYYLDGLNAMRVQQSLNRGLSSLLLEINQSTVDSYQIACKADSLQTFLVVPRQLANRLPDFEVRSARGPWVELEPRSPCMSVPREQQRLPNAGSPTERR